MDFKFILFNRWVTSHSEISKKNFRRHKLIVKGLEYLISKESMRQGGQSSVEQGEELLRYLTDRNALATIAFNLDIQQQFSQESLVYQKRLSCLIGQVDREWRLTTHLELLKNCRGQQFENFLKECKCGQLKSNMANCQNLQEFENAKYVTYNDIDIFKGRDYLYPKLSDFKIGYIDAIKEELNKFFPRDGDASRSKVEAKIFNPLNQAMWPHREAFTKHVVIENSYMIIS